MIKLKFCGIKREKLVMAHQSDLAVVDKQKKDVVINVSIPVMASLGQRNMRS